jgi:hypothetical protein
MLNQVSAATYPEILRDRIERGEIDRPQAIKWLMNNAEISEKMAEKLMEKSK